MKFNRRGTIIIAVAMVAVMLTSGAVFAKTKKPAPSQYQQSQNWGPSSEKFNKPGNGEQHEWNQEQKRDKRDFDIEEMRYSKGGNLQIKIKNPDNEALRWDNNQKIVVRDSHGRAYNARVKNFDRNVLELIVANLVLGERYSAEIYGRDDRNRDYRVRGDFWAQDNWRYNRNYSQGGSDIEKIWYDGSGRVRITLNYPRGYNIRWNGRVRVSVRDSQGRSYIARIIRTGQNSVELAISGVRYGRRYSVEISGTDYDNRDRTIVTSFWARD